ncbi:MAG: adenylyl-sulfate kinase [Deltaproteobacteria bacterium RIFOXYA12_FULL_58_15]|nr:MAG: adenylyl-sulfate kinase [Deltaproteobacteria bacterium RIFOXYA12_FULL_58_15]OGR08074.1 MAG: adenylyl-sulfate kinase [Deltaproteobacteria bacterium RIFOXYB12_FULL_58_9]
MGRATNVHWYQGSLTREERWSHLGAKGCTIWFTGLSASGKSTISSAVEKVLVSRGVRAYRLDGDNLRHGLNADLGFSADDRVENVRRVGEVARLFADAGSVALSAFISPYLRDRDACRQAHDKAGLPFLEVFVDAPLAVCEQRDPKGLYQKAREGLIQGFTGIDDPYEPPRNPDLVLKTHEMSIDQCVDACLGLLEQNGLLSGP